ncbi:hypothetical protein N7478_002051 [Penicillium angulare]|uniref:uncharacterized protein n=1 Tax=Penicillium angulare TaxID=116970 RepID=UPI002541BD0F|nr:uncharacterized protein N7478_002051 [Penicillium angulare]KAJ5289021.1 hypothetical protein N7478_002051 [Penicillium angulare]
MNLQYLFVFLAAAGVSFAAQCPFAKFAKAGDNGVPEIDHEKLGDFVAKMKQLSPDKASLLDEQLHEAFDKIAEHDGIRGEL